MNPFIMIEANIDDMNPEIYGYIMEKAFEEGALDVFFTQIIMKKNRPGIKLSILCSEEKREKLEAFILKETTTFGLRRYTVERNILDRKFIEIETKYGIVPIKVGLLGEEIIKYAPEYEVCKKIAEKYKIPIQIIYQEINDQAKKQIFRIYNFPFNDVDN